jgi:hypothetical protein
VLLVLPIGVRLLAERRAEALTGREVTIADVDLNVFTRRLVATDVRVHAAPAEPEPPTLARLTVDRADLPLEGADVYLARTAPDRFNVSDVAERIAARPGKPVQAAVDTLVVSGGRVQLHDAAVDPGRSWVLNAVNLQAHDLVTVGDVAAGRASATFVLAGAPGALQVEGFGLRPLQGRAALTLEGLEMAGLGPYIVGEAAVAPTGGRLTTRLTVDDDPGGAVRASGEASLRDLALARPGQEPALLVVPTLSLLAHELRYAGGEVDAGRMELAADRLRVHDAAAPRPRPIDVTGLQAIWEIPPDAEAPAAGRLTLAAALPTAAAWRLVASPIRWRPSLTSSCS